jgi:hypothetical protein
VDAHAAARAARVSTARAATATATALEVLGHIRGDGLAALASDEGFEGGTHLDRVGGREGGRGGEDEEGSAHVVNLFLLVLFLVLMKVVDS